MLQDWGFALHDVDRAVVAGSRSGCLKQNAVIPTSFAVGGLTAICAVKGMPWGNYHRSHNRNARVFCCPSNLDNEHVARRWSSICGDRDFVCGVRPSRGLAVIMEALGTWMPALSSVKQSACRHNLASGWLDPAIYISGDNTRGSWRLRLRDYVHQRQGLGDDDPSLLTGDNQHRPKCNPALAFGCSRPRLRSGRFRP